MSLTVQEPLRDRIGRALYEEPCDQPRDWYALSEERREPWRRDADRVIALLAEEGWPKAANAGRLLRHHIASHNIPEWNDTPGRTKGEVLKALRGAALSAGLGRNDG